MFFSLEDVRGFQDEQKLLLSRREQNADWTAEHALPADWLITQDQSL